jgi:hypothetical protein
MNNRRIYFKNVLILLITLAVTLGLCISAFSAPGITKTDSRESSRYGVGEGKSRFLSTTKPLSDGLAEEWVKGDGVHYLGAKPSPLGGYTQINIPQENRLTLSTSADLSSELPPVGNQGSQGSCTAWATSYYYKSWLEKQEHTNWNLTESCYQYSPSFVYNQINGGVDEGSYISDALYLLETKGDVDIAEFPYNQYNWTAQPSSAEFEAAKPYRIADDWGYFWMHGSYGPYPTPNDIDIIKSWLNGGNILVVSIPVYYDFPDFYGNPASEYYDYDEYSSFAGGHALAVVGYDDNVNPAGSNPDHRGGFKIVNSWGLSWNGTNQGYVYLSYDFVKRYVWEAWGMNDISPDGPTVSSLSSSSGRTGDTIHIFGNNFGTYRRSAGVDFNGVMATDLSFINGNITVKVPAGATTGLIIVYDWEGTASNSKQFTLLEGDPLPLVNRLLPRAGPVGTEVTIAGTGFGNSRSSSYVSFGSDQVIRYISWSDTQIVCKVPAGASGAVNLSVTTAAGRSNLMPFKVVPRISKLAPLSGSPGTQVTITGTGFGTRRGTSTVTFGRTEVTRYVSWSNTQIVCKVPATGAGTKLVKVTTAGGRSSGMTFTVK